MKALRFALIFVFVLVGLNAGLAGGKHGISVSPDKLIGRLIQGNKRFVSGELTYVHSSPEERASLTNGQQPFAVVVGCADSRVPPELVFDQRLGQLFVVRVAGQVLDDPSLGSIEYAVEHLGSRLIVVLGHEKCGAVKAAVEGGEAPGHIHSLVDAIKPAVEKAHEMPGELLDNAVRANVDRVVEQLKTSGPILDELVRHGEVAVVGGIYDLDSGKVEFMTKNK